MASQLKQSTSNGSRMFEYTVRQGDRIVSGRVEAKDQASVNQRLRTMGLAALSINEVQTSGLQREVKIPGLGDKKVSLKDLAVMARQLATMVSAGLSLLRALNILADQTESPALAKILAQVRTDVETGSSLSVSMQKHSSDFPPLMINIIRAGETGGFLESALVSVAENYEAEVALRAKIKSAMTYPVMVFILSVVAVAVMLIFIVPIFDNMFKGLGGTLPLPTLFLVKLSDAMIYIAPITAVALVLGLSWWGRHKNDEAVRAKTDPIKLKIPVFGKLFAKVALARFTRNFSTMLGAGVPILQSLDIVGETSGNYVIERAIKDVQSSVRNGQSLSAPLAEHEVFPPMVVQMMSVGEDAGALEQMLEKVADFYDEEVSSTTEQLTSLIEPLMIAFLGIMVGGMVVALYLPIFNIFDLIE